MTPGNFATRFGKSLAADSTTFTTPNIAGGPYQFRLLAQFPTGWKVTGPFDVTIPTFVGPTISPVTTTPVNAIPLGNATLIWVDVVGEIQYRVEWWTPGNFATRFGKSLAADSTTFTTPNIPGGAYQFRLLAKYPTGWGVTGPFDVTIPTFVGPTISPVTTTPVNATLGNATLIWVDVVGEIQYRVEWWTPGNFATRFGKSLAADSTTFTTPNIPGGAYQFRLLAKYPTGWGVTGPFDVTIPTTP